MALAVLLKIAYDSNYGRRCGRFDNVLLSRVVHFIILSIHPMLRDVATPGER